MSQQTADKDLPANDPTQSREVLCLRDGYSCSALAWILLMMEGGLNDQSQAPTLIQIRQAPSLVAPLLKRAAETCMQRVELEA